MNSNLKFPTTQWTRLELERSSGSGPEWVCEAYRPAILRYLKLQYAHHDAEDLCQEFFRHVVLSGPLIERAVRNKGSLRGLLHVSLTRFLINRRRQSFAAKRGGGRIHVSLDENLTGGPSIELTAPSEYMPDQAFDKAWASHLLAQAIARTGEYCARQGKQALFEALLPQIDGGDFVGNHGHVAELLGMSKRDVTLVLRSLRLRVGRYLHDEIVATVAGNGSVADELEVVKQALRHE